MTQSGRPWYAEFYGLDYLQALGSGLTNTAQEAEFVVNALGLNSGDRVLDLCCGQGRHAVLLAERGLAVTGQDHTTEYLHDARAAARAYGVDLCLVNSDMREIPFEGHFDAVINMFSSFGNFESQEDDRRVLAAISKALKPGGRWLMDLLNREWVIANNLPTDWRENDDGTVVLEQRELNLQTSRNHVTFTFIDKEGRRRHSVGHRIRLYTLTEVIQMMASADLLFERAYGGFDSEPYTASTRRMIVVGRKHS